MRLAERLRLQRLAQLIRFYQAAAVNTLFGYGVYAITVHLGLDKYVAQIVAQVLGVTFNYFTYSRHAFRDREAAKSSFALAYLSNYLVNLALLWVFAHVVRSDYAAGLAATLGASAINFLILRGLVFKRRQVAEEAAS